MIPWNLFLIRGNASRIPFVPKRLVALKDKKKDGTRLPIHVRVERIIPGGHGLAFYEGKAVFVPSSAPGDQVEILEARDRGNHLEALRSRLMEPSSLRQTPPCPHYGPCGGCDLQHLQSIAQLEAKREILLDSLRRLGKIDFPRNEIRLIASPAWHYRNRIQIKIEPGHSKASWGFFRTGTHQVEPLDDCLIVIPSLWGLVKKLQNAFHNTPGLEDQLSGLEILAADPPDFLLDIHPQPRASNLPRTAMVLRSLLESLLSAGSSATLWLSPRERVQLLGRGHILKNVEGLTYQISHGVFFQVNEFLLKELKSAAAQNSGGKRALDLFCGAGFFTLDLASRFEEVWGIEANPSAVKDMEASLHLNGLQNIQVRAEELTSFLRWAGQILPTDFLLLDPPRAGLPPDILEKVAALQALEAVYVSCDPSTLARDLRIFCRQGYQLKSLALLDLFPQTHHLETVARLKRV
jgi:23S rRNA (uracil1939-C5)-methyltransferase